MEFLHILKAYNGPKLHSCVNYSGNKNLRGRYKGLQIIFRRGVTGVTFGSFSLPHKLYMVQFKVTNRAQAYMLESLHWTEMTQGRRPNANTNRSKF